MNNTKQLQNLLSILKQILNEDNYLIECLKPIQSGFTNHTYYLKMNNKEYQLRITSNNNIVDRENEYNVLNNTNLINIDYLYYENKTGNSIKKWIKAKSLNEYDLNNFSLDQFKQIIFNINNKINQLHKFSTNKIIQHDNFVFIDNLKNNTKIELKKYLDLYTKLVDEFYNHPNQDDINDNFVLSHNDLSLSNVLLDNEFKVNFIDFEWTRINRGYWDYANFIREADLSLDLIKYWCNINKTLVFNKLIVYIYLTTCFAIQWSYSTTQNESVKRYREKTMIKLQKYYQWIKELIYESK